MKPVDPVEPEKPEECPPAEAGAVSDVDGESREEEYSEDPEASDWIEIELRDEAGEPVPGERYKIQLANGRFLRGSLDENGYARHEKIPSGPCRISFVNLDKEAWE